MSEAGGESETKAGLAQVGASSPSPLPPSSPALVSPRAASCPAQVVHTHLSQQPQPATTAAPPSVESPSRQLPRNPFDPPSRLASASLRRGCALRYSDTPSSTSCAPAGPRAKALYRTCSWPAGWPCAAISCCCGLEAEGLVSSQPSIHARASAQGYVPLELQQPHRLLAADLLDCPSRRSGAPLGFVRRGAGGLSSSSDRCSSSGLRTGTVQPLRRQIHSSLSLARHQEAVSDSLFLPAPCSSSRCLRPHRVRPERGKAREGLWAAQSSSEAGRGKLIVNRNARLSLRLGEQS